MRSSVRLRGTGIAQVAAYGIADAEIALEKELARAWPGARLEIPEIHRTETVARIVETFELVYRLALEVEVDTEDDDDASTRKAALQAARRALTDTRFARVAWEK